MERLAQEFLASLEHKSREELLARRNGLFFLINGDVFWPMPKWPKKCADCSGPSLWEIKNVFN